MSSDYRPRGGGESGGGRGGRRRRGGRGRGPGSHGHSHGEGRAHTNGHSHGPKKPEGPLTKFINWLTGKNKKKPEPSAPLRTSSTARPEFREREREPREREPRAERPPREREDRPQRAEPTPQEITTPKLYVGNLAYEAAESDLFDHFSKVGAVKNVEVAMDRRSSRSKGFGFVEMETLETAKLAAEKYNRTDFMGRQIVVSGAKLEKRPMSGAREESEPEPQHEHGDGADSSADHSGGSTESTI
jgi:RNA recognition motif-containing protein